MSQVLSSVVAGTATKTSSYEKANTAISPSTSEPKQSMALFSGAVIQGGNFSISLWNKHITAWKMLCTIFFHSLFRIRKLTRSLPSLVRFLILLNSWIKIVTHIFHEVISILFYSVKLKFSFRPQKNSPFPMPQSIKLHISALVLSPCLISRLRCDNSQVSTFGHMTWQHSRESPWHVRRTARIYFVTMAQFVLKITKLPHVIGARGSNDYWFASSIMAPDCIATTVSRNIDQTSSRCKYVL